MRWKRGKALCLLPFGWLLDFGLPIEPKSMDVLTDYFSSRRLWENSALGASVSLFELWSGGDTTIEVQDRQIDEKNVHQVSGHSKEQLPAGKSKECLLRLVVFEKSDNESTSSLSKEAMARLLDKMKLRPAYDYLSSCFADVETFPNKNDTMDGSVTYGFCYHPKLAFAWNHVHQAVKELNRPCLQGIAFVEKASEFKEVFKQRWRTDILLHPMFPAFAMALHLTKRTEDYQNEAKDLVRSVETRTGFHSFKSRHEVPKLGDLGSLYAEMSGCATKLANHLRRIAMVDELHDFVLLHCDNHQEPTKSGSKVLVDLLAVTKRRSGLQKVDNSYILHRVEIQINAVCPVIKASFPLTEANHKQLCNIISAMDSINNFKIARSSQLIAVSSQQDSSSMKILAVVAMLFLPGSFVAALFSTPIFDWAELDVEDTNIGVRLRPQFGLFWMVVGPLTLLVFVLYALWLVYQHRVRVRQHSATEQQLHRPWQLGHV